MINQIPCFNFLDRDKQALVVQNLVLKKKKKGDFIYRQNSPVTHFYILKNGEVRIEKQTNCFMQNPNFLYSDRKKLFEDTLP